MIKRIQIEIRPLLASSIKETRELKGVTIFSRQYTVLRQEEDNTSLREREKLSSSLYLILQVETECCSVQQVLCKLEVHTRQML